MTKATVGWNNSLGLEGIAALACPSDSAKPKKRRSGRACLGCRKFKAKCSGTEPCVRCADSGIECHFTGTRRGKRAVPRREDPGGATKTPLFLPTAQADWLPKESDLQIPSSSAFDTYTVECPRSPAQLGTANRTSACQCDYSSIHPTSSLTDDLNPLALLAEACQDIPGESAIATQVLPDQEVLLPVSLRRKLVPPLFPSALLRERVVTMTEATALFDIYFSQLHRHLPLLSKAIHTPESTANRYPFLFTCICTISARYYPNRPELYHQCLTIAKQAGCDVLFHGRKSLEAVQGFVLLSKWHQPAEEFEEDMSYQLSGIAIRMAMDLHLHKDITLPAQLEDPLREQENRQKERTWLILFVTDRSMSVQMGQPLAIAGENNVVRSPASWAKQRRDTNGPEDEQLVAMVELHRVVGEMIDAFRGVSQQAEPQSFAVTKLLIKSYEAQLSSWQSTWLKETANPRDLEGIQLHESLGDGAPATSSTTPAFYFHYYRVLLYSFGVRCASHTSADNRDHLRCVLGSYKAAVEALRIAKTWYTLGWLSVATTPTFITISYVAAFLLKFITPVYAEVIPPDTIRTMVEAASDLLEKSAVNDTHSPMLYGRFLRLLLKQRMGTQSVGGEAGGLTPDVDFSWMSKTPPEVLGDGFPDSLGSVFALSQPNFWDNMLLPGLNGPLWSLSGPDSLQIQDEGTFGDLGILTGQDSSMMW